jgi:hypothetical protein
MTTHDEHLDTSASAPAADAAPAEASSLETESASTQREPLAQPDQPSAAAEQTDVPAAQAEPVPAGDESTSRTQTQAPDTRSETSAASTESSSEESLFASDDLSGLRSHWDEVQAAFVDDPQQCVQRADALVAQVVEQLTTGFSEARARLEAQWARGEEASTEDLRLALKRYREFFQRLLAV